RLVVPSCNPCSSVGEPAVAATGNGGVVWGVIG
ncbi:MAG: hypothetical protein ACJAUC_005042, partial [Planctomycetota bacterium]